MMFFEQNIDENAMITCYKIGKKFKDQGFIVKDVSFHVKCREIVGILGPSGAGKSTIFNMLTLFTGRDTGQIELSEHQFNGYIKNFNEVSKLQMGLVF